MEFVIDGLGGEEQNDYVKLASQGTWARFEVGRVGYDPAKITGLSKEQVQSLRHALRSLEVELNAASR